MHVSKVKHNVFSTGCELPLNVATVWWDASTVSLSAAHLRQSISRWCSDVTSCLEPPARPCNCIKRRVPPSSSSCVGRLMMPAFRSQQRWDIKGQKRGAASDKIIEDRRPLKKQKRDGYLYFLPPKFWDGLSTIPFTCNVLGELDQQN